MRGRERERKGKVREEKRRWVDDAPAAAFNTQFGNSGVTFIVVLLTFCFASSFHCHFHNSTSFCYVISISFCVLGLCLHFFFVIRVLYIDRIPYLIK